MLHMDQTRRKLTVPIRVSLNEGEEHGSANQPVVGPKLLHLNSDPYSQYHKDTCKSSEDDSNDQTHGLVTIVDFVRHGIRPWPRSVAIELKRV